MTEPCRFCGAAQLAAVRLPGQAGVEAVVCLHCGEVQPVPVEQSHARDQQGP